MLAVLLTALTLAVPTSVLASQSKIPYKKLVEYEEKKELVDVAILHTVEGVYLSYLYFYPLLKTCNKVVVESPSQEELEWARLKRLEWREKLVKKKVKKK